MSVRGPRGGRVRARGSGRGRGRGRAGRTILWEWESYTPGPEVYEQLWHIRKEPVIVTPHLDTDCPIPEARSRIIDRRQTEDDVRRNFYIVEVIHANAREQDEILHVDLSAILDYVSPYELERYENEQFSIEAEAEAVALRVEAEERIRRRLEKNARVPGTGKGSRMLNSLGMDSEAPVRGRPRGRGRGRGRGNRRGRATLAQTVGLQRLPDETPDVEQERVDVQEEDMQETIPETESEDEVHRASSQLAASPGVMRSAFVANSALPISLVQVYRRLSNAVAPTRQYFDEGIDDSNLDLIDADVESVSSAALQLKLEEDRETRMQWDTSEIEDSDHDRHRDKRTRSESTNLDSRHTLLPRDMLRGRQMSPHYRNAIIPSSTAGEMSDTSNQAIPADPPSTNNKHYRARNGKSVDEDTIHVSRPRSASSASPMEDDTGGVDENGNTDTEEYVVERILEHYHDEDGIKHYLVKWAGYENSQDWLEEKHLGGAAELLAEYNAKLRRKKGKHKAK